MKKIIILFVVFLSLTACTRSEKSALILSDAGYTDIKMRGYSWFSCSKGDFYQDAFTAKNVNGKVINGTVCAGILKGSTIRFD